MFFIVHYSQNTFTVLKVSNFTIFYQKKYILNFWKGTNYKSPCGIRARDFEIRSKRSHPLRYAVWYKFIWGGLLKLCLILLFISIESTSTWRCLIIFVCMALELFSPPKVYARKPFIYPIFG